MPVGCVLGSSPECAELAAPLQPHPPTLNRSICQIFVSSHEQSSQVVRGSAGVSLNPLSIFSRVLGSPSPGSWWWFLSFLPRSGVSGGTWVGRLCSWASALDRDAPWQRDPTCSRSRPAASRRLCSKGIRRRRELAAAEAGQRAPSAAGALRGPPSLVSHAHIWTRLPVPRNFPSCLPPPRPSPGAWEGGREGGSDGGGGGGSLTLPWARGGPSRAPSRSASASGWPRPWRGEPRSQVSLGSLPASPPLPSQTPTLPSWGVTQTPDPLWAPAAPPPASCGDAPFPEPGRGAEGERPARAVGGGRKEVRLASPPPTGGVWPPCWHLIPSPERTWAGGTLSPDAGPRGGAWRGSPQEAGEGRRAGFGRARDQQRGPRRSARSDNGPGCVGMRRPGPRLQPRVREGRGAPGLRAAPGAAPGAAGGEPGAPRGARSRVRRVARAGGWGSGSRGPRWYLIGQNRTKPRVCQVPVLFCLWAKKSTRVCFLSFTLDYLKSNYVNGRYHSCLPRFRTIIMVILKS